MTEDELLHQISQDVRETRGDVKALAKTVAEDRGEFKTRLEYGARRMDRIDAAVEDHNRTHTNKVEPWMQTVNTFMTRIGVVRAGVYVVGGALIAAAARPVVDAIAKVLGG